ncbi:alpha/beta fold hydrolase [Paenibacillus gansuensis]|uniref:Alpha/beta fold hydrolase n=1 Tax=Paenibacillus gansuensis TaxID=306542 RepID=A0ABW5P9Y7_9BACL
MADMEAVLCELDYPSYVIFAYSRGVSYALGFLAERNPLLSGMILVDYPAEHKVMPSGWAEDYITNYLVPAGRLEAIRPKAVKGIEQEAAAVEFYDALARTRFPVLIMRGALEGGLITPEDERKYRDAPPFGELVTFHHSGHDVHASETEKYNQCIKHFLNKIDRL